MTTGLSRGNRVRRGGRIPGWELLTALLVLAIAASSALIFTSRVELLKLAVVLALWAAFMAAFASVIYRRQSDVDRARTRDLKLVYDLQLDREISARREYELTVESQLRRELASELRAQAADEVAALREELAVLRTNLQILFDTDLEHHPALETERTTVRAYSDWDRYDGSRYDGDNLSDTRVPDAHGTDDRTEENPIIDVPEVGVPAGPPREPDREARGRHAQEYRETHWRALDDNGWSPPAGGRRTLKERPQRRFAQHPRQQAEPATPQPEPGSPGGNGVPAPRRGRHSSPSESAADSPAGTGPPPRYGAGRQQPPPRHSAGSPNRHSEMAPAAPPPPAPGNPPMATARHRSAEPETDDGTVAPGAHTGGQTVSELLARLQTGSPGRRRHRREE
jgi:hypothetical protein